MKIEKYENYLKDYGKTTCFMENGKCSGCGNCCSNILPLKKGEAERIERYIKRNGIKENIHFGPNEKLMDLTCPFLNNENKCNIYRVRPLICRLFHCDRDSKDVAREKFNALSDMEPTLMRERFFRKEKL